MGVTSKNYLNRWGIQLAIHSTAYLAIAGLLIAIEPWQLAWKYLLSFLRYNTSNNYLKSVFINIIVC